VAQVAVAQLLRAGVERGDEPGVALAVGVHLGGHAGGLGALLLLLAGLAPGLVPVGKALAGHTPAQPRDPLLRHDHAGALIQLHAHRSLNKK
jgi:hypothetical protein